MARDLAVPPGAVRNSLLWIESGIAEVTAVRKHDYLVIALVDQIGNPWQRIRVLIITK